MKNKTLVKKLAIEIINDLQAERLGKPRKYPDLNKWGGNLQDMPTPFGKPIGQCNKTELLTLADAHGLVASLPPHLR